MKLFCSLFGWHRWRLMTGGNRGVLGTYIYWSRCRSCGLERMRKGRP